MATTQPQPPLPPAQVAARGTNSLAVVSLVAGIAGYVIPHPLLAPLIAVITGHLARSRIRRTGEGGAGLALAGLILGYLHLLLTVGLVALLLLLGASIFVQGVHSVTHIPVPVSPSPSANGA